MFSQDEETFEHQFPTCRVSARIGFLSIALDSVNQKGPPATAPEMLFFVSACECPGGAPHADIVIRAPGDR